MQGLDTTLFRFFNQTLSTPLLGTPEDPGIMPWFAWNGLFLPALLLVAGYLLIRGGRRGRLFVLWLGLVLAFNDGVVCNGLKDLLGRQRPFLVLEEVNLLVGKGGSGSMPSSHTANWFAAAGVVLLFYRRAFPVVLVIAAWIGFTRLYLGVHWPSDVLAGALIGAACGLGLPLAGSKAWACWGSRIFPLAWARVPKLIPEGPTDPMTSMEEVPGEPATPEARQAWKAVQWTRMAYLLILVLLVARWWYIGAGKIELSEDEAYQWNWSRHPALSYYSKPPMIAYTQWLGTAVWGHRELGVRFFAPLIAAILSLVLLRFMQREAGLKEGWAMVLVPLATPLLAVGATLMTIDPLNVLFWVLAMTSGWTAVRDGHLRHWVWVGVWTGLGFLSKYTALFQLLSWAVFFLLVPGARRHLRQPGPWVACLVILLSTLPVVIWNAQHDWITVTHLEERGGLHQAWQFRQNFIWDFFLAELGLMNPVFFLATLVAAVHFWKTPLGKDPLCRYLFSMGAPLFIFYSLYTIRSRVQPNWIAPSVLPLFALATIYWGRELWGKRLWVRRTFWTGWAVGLVLVILMHDTNLIGKITGQPLPASKDPLKRVRAWKATADVVEAQRQRWMQETGEECFVIGSHYGITGQLSFYIPEARDRAAHHPLVFFRYSPQMLNQFSFWETYTNRVGGRALYVARTNGETEPAPDWLLEQFESVKDLGDFPVEYRGRVFRHLQIFECDGLKPVTP